MANHKALAKETSIYFEYITKLGYRTYMYM